MNAGAAFVALALEEAENARCRAFMATFDPKTASIYDRREYARCVRRIDGDGGPARLSERLAIACLVFACIGGAAWGGLWLAPNTTLREEMDFMNLVVSATIGGILWPMFVAAAYLLLLAARFVIRGRWA